MRETIRALKYRIRPQFKCTLDADPNYEALIKRFTRSTDNIPDTFEIRGWIVHPDATPELHWYYDQKLLYRGTPWQSRADVADAFPFITGALISGFSFQVPGQLLLNAPDGALRLEARTASHSYHIWQNSSTTSETAIDLQEACDRWSQSLASANRLLQNTGRISVLESQPVVLTPDSLKTPPESVEKVLKFLNVSTEPLLLASTQLAEIEPTQKLPSTERAIIATSSREVPDAFLLRYLIGGTVYCAEFQEENPQSLARFFDTNGNLIDPNRELPSTSEGISVVVPVYNALDSTLRCVESVLPALGPNDECIIVSDASDHHVNTTLSSIAEQNEQVCFIERKENGGFIEACFSGFESSKKGNDIVLLNSDTVVAPDTLQLLQSQMYQRPAIAIGSPLSTGSPNFEIALAQGESYFDAAKRLTKCTGSGTPTAITPEGQCLYVKRWAIERFGFLDRIYGRGFCEESDLAMRMFTQGADIVCLDSVLIHHERSASFGSHQRTKQLQRNRPIFNSRWGLAYDLAFAAFKLRNPLEKIRKEWESTRPEHILKSLEVAFVLPELITAGGHLSVIQHVNTMLQRGRRAGIICYRKPETDALGLLTNPIVLSENELLEQNQLPQNLVATMWTTAGTVANISNRNQNTRGWYYVQDYEPWFYERSNQEAERSAARQSYELNLQMVAKTDFLCSVVEKLHGKKVHKICPGIANSIFYPGTQGTRQGPPRLAALYRPDKPRRGTELLLAALDELLARNAHVEIYLFGSADITACHPGLRNKIHFMGSLSSNKVAELYRSTDVVCDLSLWHGFGRMGIEAMACGAVPVLSESGGITEYAVHDKNAVIVPDDPEKIAFALNTLLQDSVYRHRLRAEGIATFRWTEEQATTDWLTLLATPESCEKAA